MKKKDIEKLFPEITEEQLKEIERIEADAFERGKKASEDAYKKAEKERLLNEAIMKSGARNTKAVKALLELDKIAFTEDGISGLSEQLSELKKNCGYLFEPETEKPQFTAQKRGGKETLENGLDGMSYKKRLKLFLENPTLYKQMQGR